MTDFHFLRDIHLVKVFFMNYAVNPWKEKIISFVFIACKVQRCP